LDLSLSSLKNRRLNDAQLYVWLLVAGVSLGWGVVSALKPGHSQDLKIIDTWLRTWLWQGSNPYYLPDYIVANYPPHAIVALSPLAWIPESWVAGVWALLNLLLAPAVGYLAFRVMKPDAERRAALLPCAMFLAWAGLRTGIGNGQFTLLIIALGLLALLFEEKRPWLGGIFLALALMKPHIGGAFLLWALFTKRWKMTLVACAVMGVGVGIFSLRLAESPFEAVRAYLGVIQHQFGRGTDVQGDMSLRVVELRPLVTLFIHQNEWANRIQQLLLVLLLGCAGLAGFLKSRLDKEARDAAVLQLCCLWVLMSVFHNPYDSTLLLPLMMGLWVAPVAAPAPSGSERRWDRAWLWLLQLAMVVEVPALWWKLSKAYDLSAFGWAGALLAHVDRLLVLGLFIYIMNRVRRNWLVGREPQRAGETFRQSSTAIRHSLTSEALDGTEIFKARFALAVKRALNFCLRLLRNVLFLRLTPPRAPRCVVAHLIGNIGDIVVAIPALIALRERYPESRLILFTSAGTRGKNLAGARELLASASFLDGVEGYATEEIRSPRSALGLLRRLRQLQPDLFVSLPQCNISPGNVLRNMLFARLTGARFGVGFEVVTLFLFSYEQAQYTGVYPSEIERNLGHLKELGVTSPAVKFEFGALDEEESRRIERVAEVSRPFVAVCPGGKQVGHRWPLERFITVARYLKHERGLTLVTVGSEGERELCDELLKAVGGGVNLAGELSLRGTTELLSRALFLLTNDTGPMHLAAAMGTPVVAVYGSKDLNGRWYPHGTGHELFRARTACRQCLFADAESDHCVSRIKVEDVLEGCQRLLQSLDYSGEQRRAGNNEEEIYDAHFASQR
jgi:ADP-heptose:LPS heptosyltransferase